ncbi:tail protein [Leminorella grimontii]|uniref:Tail protein n=1 Tax=Leminorella grimontii TaxID=82981 RepID=A0AAV5N778_9GAMM|nr:contractile injection system protein, VgrG/Pvc8 family [Leminorella grimontii]KFC92444.1 prophage tail protein [Leminorella grimontii ATCC 33999 = DSM 5078]GKX57609.1 tail protein [Leminorella grimontii]VFS55827.1 Mu-like prophage tail protein gpP [Leminorella grimontii]
MTNNTIELYVGNKIYTGWTDITVIRSIEELSGQFSLGLTRTRTDKDVSLKEGQPCRVEINGQVVISGYIDTMDRTIDAENRTIIAEGRDKTGDLVDCAARYQSGQWRNATLETIARDLCQPFGIGVVWAVDAADAAKPFRVWKLEPGETVFECLARAARHRGVMVNSNASGDLVFTTAGTERLETLRFGENIKFINIRSSWTERFSDYIVLGSSTAGGLWGDEQTAHQSTRVRVNITDPEISRYRPMVIVADSNQRADESRARADWERRRAMAHGQPVVVEVVDWFTRDKKLWMPNRLVVLDVPDEGYVERELLIVQMELSLTNDGGTTTKLTLMPAAGFDEPAQRETKTTGGLWY